MPKYIKKLLIKYSYPTLKCKVYTPYHPELIQYGQLIQTTKINTSKPLSKDITLLQSKLETVYYYGRIIDNTTLVAINNMSVD